MVGDKVHCGEYAITCVSNNHTISTCDTAAVGCDVSDKQQKGIIYKALMPCIVLEADKPSHTHTHSEVFRCLELKLCEVGVFQKSALSGDWEM